MRAHARPVANVADSRETYCAAALTDEAEIGRDGVDDRGQRCEAEGFPHALKFTVEPVNGSRYSRLTSRAGLSSRKPMNFVCRR